MIDRRGRLADDRRCQHDAGDRHTVTFGEAREHLAQLVGGGVLGMVAELLDAVGETCIGEHEGDAFERAVESPVGDRLADRGGVGIGAGQFHQCVAVVVVECGDGGVELFVGGAAEAAVEQAQRLEAVLDLIHGRSTLSAAVARRVGRRLECA